MHNKTATLLCKRGVARYTIGLIAVFTKLSLEELNNLNNGNNKECKTERNKVCCKIKMCKAKEIRKEINLNNCSCKKKRTYHCTVKGYVVMALEKKRNGRTSLGTHIERMENFAH